MHSISGFLLNYMSNMALYTAVVQINLKFLSFNANNNNNIIHLEWFLTSADLTSRGAASGLSDAVMASSP